MTIEEAMKRKKEAEAAITEIVRKLEADTGMVVHGIDGQRAAIHGHYSKTSLTVQLP